MYLICIQSPTFTWSKMNILQNGKKSWNEKPILVRHSKADFKPGYCLILFHVRYIKEKHYQIGIVNIKSNTGKNKYSLDHFINNTGHLLYPECYLLIRKCCSIFVLSYQKIFSKKIEKRVVRHKFFILIIFYIYI